LRNYKTSNLYEYLLSRALAGTIHTDLMEGFKILTGNEIIQNFLLLKVCTMKKAILILVFFI